MLKVSDAWVSVLAKKLESWWPWVAEGEFPLTATKGEEMNRYKELDPAIRLRILKALCELRADRDDIVTYINDSMKNGTGPCPFQKEKLGEDGKGTLYWCDGNEDIGYRLYKEVQVALKPKVKGEVDRLGIISQWETLATNLEEFHKAVCKFSSSKVQLEVKVAKAVEADVLPTLERLQKKKERVLKQQKKQEKLMAALRNSRVIRMGRNRTRRPVSYKFEDYDKAIEEAIEVTQQKKISRRRYGGEREPAYTSGSESVESDSSSEDHQGVNEDQNANDEREDVRCDHDNHFNNLNVEENNVGDTKSWPVRRTNASRCNEGFAGNIDMNVDESGTSLTPKQKLRKRPTTSTSVKSSMISDAEDENSYEDANKRIRVCGNSSEVASTDEDDFSR
ncbi:OLC1v1028961C1 [Oldenlandia corymbosa var. corymbosa]|nr:OLC1v1028961C1 [Oldenlandia corymbosa var. corymbosa]